MSIFRALGMAALLVAAPASLVAQGKLNLGGKSQSDLEKAVKADPNNPFTHVSLSFAYWNAKQWDEVTRELNTALELDPRNGLAHLVLAMIPYAQNSRLWKEVASPAGIPSNSVDAVAKSDEQYRLAFFTDPAVDLFIFASVSGNISGDDFAAGVNACNEARYTDCTSKIESYWAKNKGLAAGVKVIPRASYWYNALAQIHQKGFATAGANLGVLAGRPDDDTREMTDGDLARIPLSSKDMEFMTGVVQYKLNNQAVDALNIFQRMIKGGYQNYLAHVYSANIYETQRNFERAIAEREDALKTGANDPLLHYELGLTLAKANKIPESLPHFVTATEKMPNNAAAWFYLATARDATGDKAGAKAACSKVVTTATQAQQGVVQNAKQKFGC